MARLEDDSHALGSEGNRFMPSDVIPGPSLDDLFGAVGGADEATLRGEEAALINVSDAPPSRGVPRFSGDQNDAVGAAREAAVRHHAEIAATMKNPQARGLVDPLTRKRLEAVLQETADLPLPDVQTYVQNRKINVDGSVIATANKLSKHSSLTAMESLLQSPTDCPGKEKLIVNEDGSKSLQFCSCPTHRLARCAQAFGFRDKPLLWLNQHLQVELQRFNAFELVPTDGSWNKAIDGDWNSDRSLPKAMSQLIGQANVEALQSLCREKCSIWTGLKVFVAKICDQAEEIRRPTDYTHKFDV